MKLEASPRQEKGGRFYGIDPISGQIKPVEEVPKAKGDGMRKPTIEDARKLKLAPSVTEIIKASVPKPYLVDWKLRELVAEITENDFLSHNFGKFASKTHTFSRIEMEEHARRALDTRLERASSMGSALHAALEQLIIRGNFLGFQSFVKTWIPLIEGPGKPPEIQASQDKLSAMRSPHLLRDGAAHVWENLFGYATEITPKHTNTSAIIKMCQLVNETFEIDIDREELLPHIVALSEVPFFHEVYSSVFSGTIDLILTVNPFTFFPWVVKTLDARGDTFRALGIGQTEMAYMVRKISLVLDFKSIKDRTSIYTSENGYPKPREEWIYQTGGYAPLFGIENSAIITVDSTTGESDIIHIKPDTLKKGGRIFALMYMAWAEINNFNVPLCDVSSDGVAIVAKSYHQKMLSYQSKQNPIRFGSIVNGLISGEGLADIVYNTIKEIESQKTYGI